MAVRYASLSHYNHSKELWAAFSSDRYKTRAFKQRGLTSAEIDELASSSKEAIRQELSYDRRTIIFSAEDICIMRTRDLQSMCDFIAPECDQIRILFYARDPAGYSSSSFQQMIKVNAKTAYVPLPKYRKRLEKFYNILDEESIFVKRFDRSKLHGGSIVRDVMTFAGAQNAEWPEIAENESLSDSAARLLFKFNRSAVTSTGTFELIKARKAFIALISRSFPGPSFRFDPRAFHENTMDLDDIAWFEQRTGIGFPVQLSDHPMDGAELNKSLLRVSHKERRKLMKLCARREIAHDPETSARELLGLLFNDILATRQSSDAS